MDTSLNSFKLKLYRFLQQGQSLIWIDTFDYRVIEDLLKEYVDSGIGPRRERIKVWDAAWGGRAFLHSYSGTNQCEKVIDAVQSHTREKEHQILLLREIASLFESDVLLLPALQEFVISNTKNKPENRRSIVIVSSIPIQMIGLEKLIERLELPLPDANDIEFELGFIKEDGTSNVTCFDYGKVFEHRIDSTSFYRFSEEFLSTPSTFQRNKKRLITSLLGMHLYDIRQLLQSIQYNTKSMITLRHPITHVPLDEFITAEKKRIVKNSGLLEVIDLPKEQKNFVGNIEGLLSFLERQKKIIDNIDSYPNFLPKPKGLLLVGAPGCGKSETAKAIASLLDKPLLRLDIGSLMGQYVGISEHNLIEAIRIAEAAQPCVLWIDEIEKAFAGFGNYDSGNDITVMRMVGYFLTWMQERKSLVYLVATANNLENLRPELLRKGRWDQIFYLSYPNESGAKDIFTKCVDKYQLIFKGSEQELLAIAKLIVEYEMSGADIDSLVVDTFNRYWFPNDSPASPFLYAENVITLLKLNKSKEKRGEYNEEIVNRYLLEYKISMGGAPINDEDELRNLLDAKYGHKSPQEQEAYFESKGYVSAAYGVEEIS